ncbi:OsmC-like protein [Abortiporus biennis]|nr:OsmC-like protein [Abortiporus biennis]
MHPSRLLARPLSAGTRIMQGAAGRYTVFPNNLHGRGMLDIKDHIYFARATAEGEGRNGIIKSMGDVPLELKMATPKQAGGKGDGQNPEQLFAMSYASCFLDSLQLVASRANRMDIAEKVKVHSAVFLGHPKDPSLPGFGLRVEVDVEGCDDDEIIGEAHEGCAYSRALRHGIDIKVSKI